MRAGEILVRGSRHANLAVAAEDVRIWKNICERPATSIDRNRRPGDTQGPDGPKVGRTSAKSKPRPGEHARPQGWPGSDRKRGPVRLTRAGDSRSPECERGTPRQPRVILVRERPGVPRAADVSDVTLALA